MNSLAYQKFLTTLPYCICGAPKQCRIHLDHFGMGNSKANPSELHYLSGPGCNECHDILDGRASSESGFEHYQEVKGINIVWEFYKIFANWVYSHEPPRERKQKESIDKEFAKFWRNYPKKVGKSACLRKWKQVKPPLDKCLESLEWQKKSEEWTKADPRTGKKGAFIPHPLTYLNQGRWDDEPMEEQIDVLVKNRPTYEGEYAYTEEEINDLRGEGRGEIQKALETMRRE